LVTWPEVVVVLAATQVSDASMQLRAELFQPVNKQWLKTTWLL
jgi:hypothetical protein